jgi:hypothetical protein
MANMMPRVKAEAQMAFLHSQTQREVYRIVGGYGGTQEAERPVAKPAT